MKTTINIDDALLTEAKNLTGLKTKTELVEAGLRALVQLESARRLSALTGKVKDASAPYRRKSHK